MAKNRKDDTTKHSAEKLERRIAQLEATQLDQDKSRQALLAMLEDLEESRRKIEHARKEWAATFDAVRDPIFLHDAEFRILRANRAYAARAGLPIEETIGQPYWQVFPKNSGPLPCCLRAAEKAEEEEEEEVNLATGEIFRSRTFSVRDTHGAYLYSVHILDDITEKRHAENTLKESEQRLRTMAASVQDALLMIDGDGLITFWNPAAERQFGYSQTEALGKPIHALIVPPAYHAKHIEGLAWFKATGQGAILGKVVQLPAQRKDGTQFEAEHSIAGVQVGGRWHAVGVVRDITERKRAEQSLRRANRALQTLSGVNQALIKAPDERSLLGETCRVIVETGGYRLAWVGYVEHDEAKTVRPVAYRGFEEGYLESLGLTWADTERGRGPTGRAIRSGKPALAQDILSDPAFAPWRAEAEARGYASSISLPLLEMDEVFGALNIYSAETGAFDAVEVTLLQELADDLAFGILTLRTRSERDRLQIEHLKSGERLKATLIDTIRAIALTVEKRDPYTAGHQNKVAELCVAIGRELGLPDERLEGLRLGATIHDIGKVYIPAEILNRPGKLTNPEFEMIKTHPQVGYGIIKDVKFPWPVAEMILQHHERLDGSGYPKGLKGEEIILEARILAVADTVEAMSSHRPYRPSVGLEPALEEITRHRDALYDPAVVDACLRLFKEKGFKL